MLNLRIKSLKQPEPLNKLHYKIFDVHESASVMILGKFGKNQSSGRIKKIYTIYKLEGL
jgi:hypothetical protein